LRKTEVDKSTSMLNAAMRPRHRMTRVNSSCNTREAEASQNMADGTLSPNSRELEDGEVVDITELSPEGHDISQDVEDILDADHMSPTVHASFMRCGSWFVPDQHLLRRSPCPYQAS
jgi:hypothetical protein